MLSRLPRLQQCFRKLRRPRLLQYTNLSYHSARYAPFQGSCHPNTGSSPIQFGDWRGRDPSTSDGDLDGRQPDPHGPSSISQRVYALAQRQLQQVRQIEVEVQEPLAHMSKRSFDESRDPASVTEGKGSPKRLVPARKSRNVKSHVPRKENDKYAICAALYYYTTRNHVRKWKRGTNRTFQRSSRMVSPSRVDNRLYPKEALKLARGLVLYCYKKRRHGARRGRTAMQQIHIIRNALASNLYAKAIGTHRESTTQTTIDAIGERVARLKLRRRASKLSKNGTFSKVEMFLPYWNVSFMKIFTEVDQPWRAEDSRSKYWGFEFEDFVKKRFRIETLGSSPADIAVRWFELPPRVQRRYWMSALLYVMAKAPLQTVRIFRSMKDSHPHLLHSYVVQDCVHFLCSALLRPFPETGLKKRKQWRIPGEYIKACDDITLYSLEHCFPRFGSASLSSRAVNLLTQTMPEQRMERFQQQLAKNNVKLSLPNLVNFSRYFANRGRLGESLDWLSRIPPEEKGSDQTLQLCCKLLCEDFETDNIYKLRTTLLSAMLELGIKPNRVMHNIVLNNAMEAGDRQTAWSYHRIISQNGVPATTITYAILLKGVRFGDGQQSISSIYQETKDLGLLQKSPNLAFALIHATYMLEKRRRHTQPFQKMLNLYTELFDLSPLQDIGIALGVSATNSEGSQLMSPSVQVLGCMVIAWLEENHKSHTLEDVYWMFLHHLRKGDSRIAILGNHQYVYRAFILAFGRRGGALDICSSIVQGMQRPTHWQVRPRQRSGAMWSLTYDNIVGDLGNPTDEKPGSRHELTVESNTVVDGGCQGPGEEMVYHRQIPKPDGDTWSFALYAHMLGRKSSAAENILKGMRKLGHEPSSVSWNSLINGYARLGNITGVVSSLQRQGKAGYEPDEETMRALSRINDQNALRRALERTETTPSTDIQ